MKALFSANASVKSSDDVTPDYDDEGKLKREVPDNEVKSRKETPKCPDSDFPQYL